MPTRNVVLTDHEEKMIESLVDSGRYQNASEVMREGLRMVETRAAEDQAKLMALRDAAKVGDDAFARGAFKSFPDASAASSYLGSVADRLIDGQKAR